MDPIPEEVWQFLAANIDSLEQLEILRVLGEDRVREWPDDEIGKQVQSAPGKITMHLNALEARGMLTCVRRDGRVFCRYGPQSPELEPQILRLLELYEQRPVTMIRMVYERANNALRNFADAFRLKKEE